MSTTPNLLIDHIATAQNNKETTANTAFDDFDGAISANLPIAMADADLTVTQDQALRNMALIFTGTLSADRIVTLPANAKPFIVFNHTGGSPAGFNLTIKVGTGAATALLTDTDGHLIYSDGVNSVYKVS